MTYERVKVARDVAPHIDQLPTRLRENFPEIVDPTFWAFYDRCRDYSLVHVTGFYNVYQSFHYLAANGIRGNAVECGCFLGGIATFMGLLRDKLGLAGMEIILFDTFAGAPAGSTDVVLGAPFVEPCALPSYRDAVPETIAQVVGSTRGYRFVEGLVEETLPRTETGDLALLRLDTDYYSSTAIEYDVLYPRLVAGAVLIVDDYGMFQGSRRATDEYLARLDRRPLMNRIDIGVWAGVKP
jgi:O-methyltransferase